MAACICKHNQMKWKKEKKQKKTKLLENGKWYFTILYLSENGIDQDGKMETLKW